MIIRKITEVTETKTTETYHLICHEKDEGWELSREEMEKLKNMTERSLEDFYDRREKETVPAELYEDLYKRYTLACFQLDEARTKSLENPTNEADQAEEYPDYIEPPAPEVVCEKGVCQLVLPEEEEIPEPAAEVTESTENLTISDEKSQETPQKAQKAEPRDFSKYVDMALKGITPKMIIASMAQDMEISTATATTYWYSKVKPLAAAKDEQDRLRAIEAEKKQLERKLEKNIQVIPPAEPKSDKPEKGKYFSDEERLRIQKKLGLK